MVKQHWQIHNHWKGSQSSKNLFRICLRPSVSEPTRTYCQLNLNTFFMNAKWFSRCLMPNDAILSWSEFVQVFTPVVAFIFQLFFLYWHNFDIWRFELCFRKKCAIGLVVTLLIYIALHPWITFYSNNNILLLHAFYFVMNTLINKKGS